MKERGYDEPRKHEVVFSLNIDLEKRIYNRPRPLTHDRQEIKEEVLAMEKNSQLAYCGSTEKERKNPDLQ